jgi:hypothetical protein
MPASYKPSPLGYGSPRSSPFRRPESPASSSPLRQTTPTTSLSKGQHNNDRSRLASPTTPTKASESWAPRAHASIDEMASPESTKHRATVAKSMNYGNSLSQLQPAQVRTLREGFQILDRDSDGVVNREDVADMLNQLGMCPLSVCE